MAYRYHDVARKLSEDLAEIKIAAVIPKESELGGLDRIAQGNTALKSTRDTRAAAQAGVGDAVREAEVRRNLQRLVATKKAHDESELAAVVAFTKAANMASADVALNQMMSGSGGPATPERQEAQSGGRSHQGPAGDLIARSLKEHDTGKIAASRLDKEVAKGNVSYGDAFAGADRAANPKGFSRGAAFEPGAVDASTLGRRRALNAAKFNNEHLRAEGARQRTHGWVSKDKFTPERALQHQNEIDRGLFRRNIPGMGPATMIEGNTVHVGDNAGKFVRGVADGVPKFFGKDVDRTLNYATLEHEKGERDLLLGRQKRKIKGKVRPLYHPHASHLGVDPILRENLAVQGDPEAVKIFKKLRDTSDDDGVVQRLARQVGAHPDSPIPLDGKRHRALQDRLEKQRRKLQSPIIGGFQERGRFEESFGKKTIPHVATHTQTPFKAQKPHPKSLPPSWLSQNKGKAIAAAAAGGLGIGGAALYAHLKNKKRDKK